MSTQVASLSSADVARIQDSFAKLAPRAGEASEAFYAALFRRAPETRAMFPKDMTEQREKLIATLAYVVRGLGNLSAIRGAVRDLGARHKGYRVKPEHYSVVGQALLEMLQAKLGPAFTPDVRQAWTRAYEVLAGEMIDAAKSASAR